jgi:hypothetical protein
MRKSHVDGSLRLTRSVPVLRLFPFSFSGGSVGGGDNPRLTLSDTPYHHPHGKTQLKLAYEREDYLEDANGNGVVDSGEIDWLVSGDLGLTVIITQPVANSTIP